MVRYCIVNADDFGLDQGVNEAVELAHRQGILTSASLLVGAPAAADAVARAHRLSDLRVGLHVAVVEALPVLPPKAVPRLVGRDGRLRSDLVGAGFAYAFGGAARKQLRLEIRAQFEAFAATGLALDHVNAHKHMHLHPVVGESMIEIGRDFGLRAVRVPEEPAELVRRADPGSSGRSSRWLRPWTRRLRRRVRRAGLVANDHVFGIAWSGHMTEERILRLFPCLPPGVSEVYFHPTVQDAAGELAALTSGDVRQAVADGGIVLSSFGALSSCR